DGKMAASCDVAPSNQNGDDAVIRLWDVATGNQLHVLHRYGRSFFQFELSLSFSPDNKTLALVDKTMAIAADSDMVVSCNTRLWDVRSGKLLHKPKHLSAQVRQPFQPRGKLLHKLEHLSAIDVLAVAFSPDGKTLASWGEDVRLCLWEV